MDYGLLRASIEELPETLAMWESGDNGSVQDWFNEPDQADVPVAVLTKQQFLRFALPLIPKLFELPEADRAKWQLIIEFGTKADSIDLSLPEVQAMFAGAVQDGLITQGEAAAITQRRGSRAEAQFGRNLTYEDMLKAREANG